MILVINVKISKVINVDKKVEPKIILIDPGHGGIDGGAVSKNGTVEKHINLKISLKLRDELNKKGYKTVMTREEDKGLYSDKGSIRNKKVEDLNNRCKLKESSKCDMFISIHLNKFQQSKYYGAQVWYSKNIDSKKLAEITQKNLIDHLNNGNTRKCKPAKDLYKVLRCYDKIPSILIECGFLTNPQEEQKLKSSKFQDDIAKSIAKSIEEYFNFQEKISDLNED
ncbi:N-acetylmuramoyl-L-alanine amidase CwlD [Haloimpatiens sp. FM7330]|uniref:N-acetylmuramoyl-L-alanine amidase CwlD n=1 Tax=Haloimpatiens sp. FM7330 TaxID=3298610 RepID=UPI003644BAB3